MKIRKYILCAGIVGLVGMSSGCGQKTDSGATSQAVSEQADTKENAETSGAAGAETEKETAPTVQVVTDDMVPVEADALKDGVYPVEVDSSSSMFHITEAELTVADGKMSAKLTLSGSGYGKVFMGTGEEAEKEAAILRAEAEKEKKIKEAEGQAEAIRAVQRATADGIRYIKEAGADQAVLQLKSLEAFQAAADGKANKIIIPSDIQGIAGLVKSISEIAAKEDTK